MQQRNNDCTAWESNPIPSHSRSHTQTSPASACSHLWTERPLRERCHTYTCAALEALFSPHSDVLYAVHPVSVRRRASS